MDPRQSSASAATIMKIKESQHFTSSDLQAASRLLAFEDTRFLSPSFVKSIETLPLSQKVNMSRTIRKAYKVVKHAKEIKHREEREKREKEMDINCPCKAYKDSPDADPSAHHSSCKWDPPARKKKQEKAYQPLSDDEF